MMNINIDRLMKDLSEYAQYGKDPTGGLTRPSFSEADYEIRERFMTELTDIGLDVHVDAIANIWGLYKGKSTKKQPILIGSHLDTVPNGGAFDGALGVLVAKEVIQTLIDHDVALHHPVEIVSFTAEEPNDFNLSTMGSRTYRGKIDQATLEGTTDSTGRKLSDAVKRAGGNVNDVPISQKEFAAFLELHIEQGKRLEKANVPVGIVDNIVGIYRDKITVRGKANHSGTTMMDDRFDALTAASEIALAVEEVLRDNNTDAVATIGKFDVHPNAANIIPGRVELIIEIRSSSKEERARLNKRIQEKYDEIAERRNVRLEIENILDQQECDFDPDIVSTLQQTVQAMDIEAPIFASMAGHDATHIAEITKTAMLFVKSIGGISHSPEEFTTKEDIQTAANVMLQAVVNIDRKLAE